MSIDVILFDLDETLLVEQGSVAAAFDATCAHAWKKFGINPEKLHEAVRRTARELYYQKCPVYDWCMKIGLSSWELLSGNFSGSDDHNQKRLARWLPRFRALAWEQALDLFQVDDVAYAKFLSEQFAVNRAKRYVAYPDARRILPQLAESYHLGILTNGTEQVQRDKLEGAEIDRFFQTLIISGELGFGKPDTRIFQYALDLCGTDPDKAVMVGDGLKRDIEGANEFGMKTVWVNRMDSHQSTDGQSLPILPDATIQKLDQLPDVIKTL